MSAYRLKFIRIYFFRAKTVNLCAPSRLSASAFLNINIRGSSATFMAFRIFGNAISNNSFANLICLLIYEVAKFKALSNPFRTCSSSTYLGTNDSTISDNVWNRIPSTIVSKISMPLSSSQIALSYKSPHVSQMAKPQGYSRKAFSAGTKGVDIYILFIKMPPSVLWKLS